MYMYVDVLKIHVIHFLGELFNSVVTFYSNFTKRTGKNWLWHWQQRPNNTKFYYLQSDFFL